MTKKSSMKKSNRKTRQIVKQVVYEEEIPENDPIQQTIDYCNEVKPIYNNFDFYILKDKQGYDKIEVQSRQNKRVPFVIRFARYRMVVKSFFPNSKQQALKQEETLGFNYDRRDLGPSSIKDTIWYYQVYRPELEPDFNSFKMWLDYLCDETKPKPKLSITNNHFQ
jgi:hypothetical protein